MYLTVESVATESSHESDYDTAVDLVHDSHHATTVVLATPAGAKLTVSRDETTTTRSYLEPDFDHLEATGNCVYQQHSDGAAPETRVMERACVQLPPRVLPLSPDDFRRRALWKEGKLDTRVLTFDEEEKLYGDQALDEGDGEPVSVSAEVVDQVLAMRKGSKVSDLDLPGLAEIARAADRQAQERRWANMKARTDSRAGQALYELARWREAHLARVDAQLR